MKLITTDYHVLYPAYGRDYHSRREVEQAFESGKDFRGDVTLEFKLVNIEAFAPGVKVELRYAKLGKATIFVVPKGNTL